MIDVYAVFLVVRRNPPQGDEARWIDSLWIEEKSAVERAQAVMTSGKYFGFENTLKYWIAKLRIEDAAVGEAPTRPVPEGRETNDTPKALEAERRKRKA